MNKSKIQHSDLAQMGIAALIPGLQRAVEALTDQIATYRAMLNHAADLEVVHTPELRIAEKRRNPAAKGNSLNYWAKMTPDERRAEMARRLQVRSGKRKPKPGTLKHWKQAAAKKEAEK